MALDSHFLKRGALRLVSWSPITTTSSAKRCLVWIDETQAWLRADCPPADQGLVGGRLCNGSLAKATMQNRGTNAQGQIQWQMRKGKYKGYLYEGSLGNYGWGRVFWTTDLEKYKTADLVWESKHRFGLVIGLKAINHYERSLYY